MEITRVVELVHEARAPPDGTAVGSGYLLADGLILATRHGVGERVGATCEYRVAAAHTPQGRVTLSRWLKAEVVWNGGDDIDAALLAPVGPRARDSLAPVPLGYADGNTPVPARSVGFPSAIESAGESELLDAHGEITPLSGARRGEPIFTVTSASPATANGWKGMSGAAVFAGETLVGLVEEVVTKLGVTSLRLVGAGRLLSDARAHDLLSQAGIRCEVAAVTRLRAQAAPTSGSWESPRRRYSAAVVDFYLRLDHSGALDSNGKPLLVLEAFRGQRFKYRDTDGDSARRLDELYGKPRFVVLGEPGSGKSTALKQAVALAVQADALCVPLWLPIGSVQALEPLTVPVLMSYAVERAVALGLREVNDYFLETAAREGRLLFAFDALDEAPDARRAAVRDLVAAVARTYENCRVWLSSRPSQYESIKLTEERANAKAVVPSAEPTFGVFEIEKLTPVDIAHFLRVCFADNGGLAFALLSSREIAPLLATPHFLSMTARIVREEQRIPENSSEILARWIELVCRIWEDGKRSTPAPDEIVAQRKRGLRLLAWSLQIKGTPAGTFTRRDCQLAMSPLFGATGEVGAEGLVKWFIERSDVLEVASGAVGQPDEQLRFSHRQYQEYLAGAEFASLWGSDRARAKKAIAGKWFDDDWFEMLTFAAAQIGPHADELIDAVRAVPPSKDWRVITGDFIAGTLAHYAPSVSASCLAALADALVRQVMKAPDAYVHVVGVLVGLGRHAAADTVLERVASGELHRAVQKKHPRAFRLPEEQEELVRMRLLAIDAFGIRFDRRRALELLDDLSEVDRLEAEPRRRMESVAFLARFRFGDEARTAELLDVALGTATTTSDWHNTLDVFYGNGAALFADQAIARLLRERPDRVITLGQAAIAVQRRVLELDSSLMNQRLAAATHRLKFELPNDSYASDMHPDITALMDVLPVDRPSAPLLLFLEAALDTGELLWRWGDVIRERVPQVAPKAIDAMCRYAIDWELYGDWSRRNGVVYALVRITDDAVVVPRLIDLIGVPSVFEHSGRAILRSLQARGKQAETLAVLKARTFDPANGDVVVSAAIGAATFLDPGSVDAWIAAGGDGTQRVRRLSSAPVRMASVDRVAKLRKKRAKSRKKRTSRR